MNNQHARPIGCSPVELALLCFSTHTTPENGAIDPHALKDLWQLSNMTKAIGNITNMQWLAKVTRTLQSHVQIANERFPADQKFIRLDVPRTDLNASRLDKVL